MSPFASWKQHVVGIDLKIFHERRPNPIKQYIYVSLRLRYKALLGLVNEGSCNCSSNHGCIKAVKPRLKKVIWKDKALGISPFRQAGDVKS